MSTTSTPSSQDSIGSSNTAQSADLRTRSPLSHHRAIPPITIALTLAVFAAAIWIFSHHLRQRIRDQIISRDGEILYSVTLLQQYELAAQDPLFGSFDDPATQWELILKTSRLRGVIAARLFDRHGRFHMPFPPDARPAELSPAQLTRLSQLNPVSEFHPKAHIHHVIAGAPQNTPVPLLEITIPLHLKDAQEFLGAAQFVISAESIAQQFAELDFNLLRHGATIFLAGGCLIFLGLHQAFRRLQRTNQLLTLRTTELQRANRELVLASKTTALGAVAAHLIHGLKNPLFGLKNLAEQCAEQDRAGSSRTWQTAADTAGQMQSLINEVVRVLQDEQTLVDCQITFDDLIDVIQTKTAPASRQANIQFVARNQADASLPYRAANLILLILQNLIQNAIQATPSGKRVSLHFSSCDRGIVCHVRDEGTGIPPDLQKNLFAPCRSSKPNSSGIGLAISKQLANHLGAELDLETSTEIGSVFRLVLPDHLIVLHPAAFAA